MSPEPPVLDLEERQEVAARHRARAIESRSEAASAPLGPMRYAENKTNSNPGADSEPPARMPAATTVDNSRCFARSILL